MKLFTAVALATGVAAQYPAYAGQYPGQYPGNPYYGRAAPMYGRYPGAVAPAAPMYGRYPGAVAPAAPVMNAQMTAAQEQLAALKAAMAGLSDEQKAKLTAASEAAAGIKTKIAHADGDIVQGQLDEQVFQKEFMVYLLTRGDGEPNDLLDKLEEWSAIQDYQSTMISQKMAEQKLEAAMKTGDRNAIIDAQIELMEDANKAASKLGQYFLGQSDLGVTTSSINKASSTAAAEKGAVNNYYDLLVGAALGKDVDVEDVAAAKQKVIQEQSDYASQLLKVSHPEYIGWEAAMALESAGAMGDLRTSNAALAKAEGAMRLDPSVANQQALEQAQLAQESDQATWMEFYSIMARDVSESESEFDRFETISILQYQKSLQADTDSAILTKNHMVANLQESTGITLQQLGQAVGAAPLAPALMRAPMRNGLYAPRSYSPYSRAAPLSYSPYSLAAPGYAPYRG